MERVKLVDGGINELSLYEAQNISRNATNQDISVAWLLQQNLLHIEISNHH